MYSPFDKNGDCLKNSRTTLLCYPLEIKLLLLLWLGGNRSPLVHVPMGTNGYQCWSPMGEVRTHALKDFSVLNERLKCRVNGNGVFVRIAIISKTSPYNRQFLHFLHIFCANCEQSKPSLATTYFALKGLILNIFVCVCVQITSLPTFDQKLCLYYRQWNLKIRHFMD